MCGIVGAVGTPTDSAKTFNLLTWLAKETERRGKDASGHFYVENDGTTSSFKLPCPAKRYVQLDPWRSLGAGNFKAMMFHARAATPLRGRPEDNENNHPFVSATGSLAIIHNGRVVDYFQQKKDWDIETDCDSEIFLHIISAKNNIMAGIKDVFQRIGPGGDFACMAIYRNKRTGRARFFFFRETGRPGIYIDARKQLGIQIFCSEVAIWKDAVRKSELRKELKLCKPKEIPPYEIWVVDAQTGNLKKHKVEGITKRFSRPTYSSGYNVNSFEGHSSNCAYGSSRTATVPSIVNAKDMGPKWKQSRNDLGQYVFTYDDEIEEEQITEVEVEEDDIEQVVDLEDDDTQETPAFSISFPDDPEKSHEENEGIEELRSFLMKCVTIPALRYERWEDDAHLLNIDISNAVKETGMELLDEKDLIEDPDIIGLFKTDDAALIANAERTKQSLADDDAEFDLI